MTKFIVEDDAHRVLVTTLLGISKKEIALGGPRGRTCRLLARSAGMIGLVDEDPQAQGLPSYLKNLPSERLSHDIRIFRDTQRGNRILMLCPSVEIWAFDKARRKKVDLQKLMGIALPSEFHRVVNKEPEKWIRLIQHLEDLSTEGIALLKSMLNA